MISAARSTPSAWASSSCASRSGVSDPAAAIAIRAESRASRTGVARPANCRGGLVMSVGADPGGASLALSLVLETAALLVRFERSRELIKVAFEVVPVDLDIDVLGLGQHRNGRGRGVDAALGLGRGHALHAVGAAFELEDAVGAVALDLERVLAVADVHRVGLEAAPLGVFG